MLMHEKWYDWHWQMDHAINNPQELENIMNLLPEEKQALSEKALGKVCITPYMQKLILQENHEPLRKQFIPFHFDESFSFTSIDSLGEEECTIAPNLIKKYDNRAALLVSNRCACYCQFCTRQRFVHQSGDIQTNIEKAIECLETADSINDVLITGGDPLLMETSMLQSLLSRIFRINHVKIVRIGTRLPVTLPMRIDAQLIEMLRGFSPLYVNIHINHPLEITADSKRSILALANAGMPIGSQSVLLKGINDNIDILQELFESLIQIKVKPYYLYQCDKMRGLEHYIVSPDVGIELINGLSGRLTGFAVPRYVVDAPNKMGKLVLGPCNIIDRVDTKIRFANYRDERFLYCWDTE